MMSADMAAAARNSRMISSQNPARPIGGAFGRSAPVRAEFSGREEIASLTQVKVGMIFFTPLDGRLAAANES